MCSHIHHWIEFIIGAVVFFTMFDFSFLKPKKSPRIEKKSE